MALLSLPSGIYFPSIAGLPVWPVVMAATGAGTGAVEATDLDLVGGRGAHGGQGPFHAAGLMTSPLADEIDKSPTDRPHTITSHLCEAQKPLSGFEGSDRLFTDSSLLFYTKVFSS